MPYVITDKGCFYRKKSYKESIMDYFQKWNKHRKEKLKRLIALEALCDDTFLERLKKVINKGER